MIFLILIFFLFSNISFAQQAIVLDDSFQSQDLEYRQIAFLEDPSNQLTYEDVKSSHHFIINEKRQPNFGFTNSTYWFKFKVQSSNLPQKLFLHLGYVFDDVELYIKQPNGEVIFKKAGQKYPFSQREILHYHLIFELNPPSKTYDLPIELYLRIKTNTSLPGSFSLRSYHGLLEHLLNANAFINIYIGAIMLIVFYNFAIFISSKQSIFFFYLCKSLFVSLGLLGELGITYKYLWGNFPWWGTHSTPIGIAMAMISHIFFIKAFLKIKQHHKILNFITNIATTTCFLTLLLSLFTSLQISMPLLSVLSLITVCITVTCSCVSVIQKKHYVAIYLILGEFAFMVGIFFKVLSLLGVINSDFLAQYGIAMSALVELYAFGFALFIYIMQLNTAKNKLSKTFEKFVPQQILDKISDNKLDITLGKTEQDHISILFVDIRNFTRTAERLPPQELLTFLNFYFERCSRVVNKHGGLIDKYIGDAILALFDLQSGINKKEATQAIATAVAIQKKIFEYNHKFKDKFQLHIEAGIGIHSGNVIMGTVGSKMRMDTTIIGDAVNVASRLESLTKFYRTSILFSEDTYLLLESQENTRYIDNVMLPGKTIPLKIFQAFTHDQHIEKFYHISEKYHNAIFLYENQEWEYALKLLEQCKLTFPTDNIIDIYIQRCQEQIQNPSPTWDGIYYHTK